MRSMFQYQLLVLPSDLNFAGHVLRRKPHSTQTPLEVPDNPPLAIKRGIKENADNCYLCLPVGNSGTSLSRAEPTANFRENLGKIWMFCSPENIH